MSEERDVEYLIGLVRSRDKWKQLDAIVGAEELNKRYGRGAMSVVGEAIANYAGGEVLKNAMYAGIEIGGSEAAEIFASLLRNPDINVAMVGEMGLMGLAAKAAEQGDLETMKTILTVIGRTFFDERRKDMLAIYNSFEIGGVLEELKTKPSSEKTMEAVSEFVRKVKEKLAGGNEKEHLKEIGEAKNVDDLIEVVLIILKKPAGASVLDAIVEAVAEKADGKTKEIFEKMSTEQDPRVAAMACLCLAGIAARDGSGLFVDKYLKAAGEKMKNLNDEFGSVKEMGERILFRYLLNCGEEDLTAVKDKETAKTFVSVFNVLGMANPRSGGSSKDKERYSELKRIADDLRFAVLGGASAGEIVEKIEKFVKARGLREEKKGSSRAGLMKGAG